MKCCSEIRNEILTDENDMYLPNADLTISLNRTISIDAPSSGTARETSRYDPQLNIVKKGEQ